MSDTIQDENHGDASLENKDSRAQGGGKRAGTPPPISPRDAQVRDVIQPEQLKDLLQEWNFRAEIATEVNGETVIRSATGGLPFNIRFGNRVDQAAPVFADFTIFAIVKMTEPLPAEKINEWNRTKRFAKMYTQEDFLSMEMDVVIFAGVTDNHIRYAVELWDRLLQELSGFFRQPQSVANAAPPTVN